MFIAVTTLSSLFREENVGQLEIEMMDVVPGGGFDQEAALYDRARPPYPEALFTHLVSQSRLTAGMRALEIGPGTGQATEPLARRGLHVWAVELGPNLAEAARKRLAPYPKVTVLTGDFEVISLPVEDFDLVYAATSIHWISPSIRLIKPHRLLKPHGHLAVIHTEPVSDGSGDEFVRATQPIYREFARTPGAADYCPPKVEDLRPMPVDSALFTTVCYEIFPLRIEYTAATYVELLRTFSPTLAMVPGPREAFLAAIADVIDCKFGGRIVKHLGITLQIAVKR